MRWRAVCQVGSQARSSRFIVAFEEKNVERRTLVGVDHEGAGTTMKPVSSPRSSLSLSLSPHLLQNTRGHREASPSKYAHVSNVHFNHRSHRPSRAIAPSPLSFFLFFFSFFFAPDLSFSPARTFHPPSDSIPCNIPLPQSPTYSLETAYTFVRVPPPVFLLLFARLYLSRMQRFVWCFQLLPRLEHREDSIITGEILF